MLAASEPDVYQSPLFGADVESERGFLMAYFRDVEHSSFYRSRAVESLSYIFFPVPKSLVLRAELNAVTAVGGHNF